MSSIVFAPSTQLYLGSGKKPGRARLVACDRFVVKTEEKPKLATIFWDEKKCELRVWHEKKGITKLEGAGKYATRILDTASDGLFTAVFFHHDKKRRLGLALLQRSPSNLVRLVSDPTDYSASLDAVLLPLLSCEKKEITALLRIHRTCLRQTPSGPVVGAVFGLYNDEVYVVIGALATNVWKRFRLDAALGIPGCLRIHTDRVVSVVSCAVGSPVDSSCAVMAPTVELALSVFEQTRVVAGLDDAAGDGPSRQAEANYCVMLHEAIFSLDDRDPTIRVCYQSRLFALPQDAGGGHADPLCHLYADSEHPYYAVVVSLATQSYIVHLRRSAFDMELMARCTVLGLQGIPRGVTWLRLLHPSRPDVGFQLVVVLSQDYRVYAAEVFGDSISVQLEDGSNTVRFNSVPENFIGSEPVVENFTNSTHILRIGDGGLLCSNGLWGVVLRVTGLYVEGDVPREHLVPYTIDDESSERRVAALVTSLRHVEKLSKLNRSDLFQHMFQQVLPMLQNACSSQRGLFLTQRVFQAFSTAAAPQSTVDWRIMWALTLLLQEKLSKRDWDDSVVYTDMFFIDLVENYVHSCGTVDEQKQAKEALLNVLSNELKCAWRQFMQRQDDDVSFVLESLAERVSLIPLAEECVRRMILVSTLSNGTHVVYAVGRTCHVIHTIGTALLASCLEVPLYVNTDNAGQLVCSTRSMGETSVFVPPISFANRSMFEYALTLSTDLLCTMSPDSSFMPYAAALLSMLSARRYHVVSTFLQLFAFPLAEHLAPLEPLCDNVSLITECSAAVFLSESGLFKKFLFEPTPSDVLVVLCNGLLINDYFNTGLWHQVEGILNKGTQALTIAVVLHAMTDRLIAAQSNYSTSILKALLKEGLEHPLQEASVEGCRKRLKIVLSRLEHLWACVHAWLPYKLEDFVSAVLASNAAVCEGKRNEEVFLGDSAVFRTYVMCFRMLALVGYSYRTEKKIVELMKEATSDPSITVRVFFLLLQAIEDFRGTAVPVESFQWRCVTVAALSDSMCARTPGLAALLLELLELSGASRTAITPLKQYYYAVVDRLTEVAGEDDKKEDGRVAFDEFWTQLTNINKVVAASNAATVCFLWSRGGGADVPEWPGDHSLPTRRYLINTEWVDAMWPIEFAPQLLEECLTLAQEHVRSCDTTDSAAEAESSPHFLHALFHQLCALSPPVHDHVLPTSTEAAGVAVNGPAQISQEPHTFEERMSSPSSHRRTPSLQRVSPPLTTLNEMGKKGFLATSSTSVLSGRHVRALPFFSGDGIETAAAATAATSLFPPESVAWWEADNTLDRAPRKQHDVREKFQDIHIEVPDTATSYTTATSEKWTHLVDDSDRDVRSSCFSPRLCQRHGRRHYRCAKHRTHGTQMTARHHHPFERLRHVPIDTGLQLPRMALLTVPKRREQSPVAFGSSRLPNVLQPPPLPSSMAPEWQKQLIKLRLPQETNDVTPPPLLSLRAKPHVPRVRLFASTQANVKHDSNEVKDFCTLGTATNCLLGSPARSPSPLRALIPPTLPPSSVFVDPPPLLRLNTPTASSAILQRTTPQVLAANMPQQEDHRVRDVEESLGLPAASAGARIVTPVHPTINQQIPICLTAPPPESIFVGPPTRSPLPLRQEEPAKFALAADAFLQTRKEGELMKEETKSQAPPVFAAAAPRPVVAHPERSAPTVSSLREPVLSPSEVVAFHKYVDELKATGTAVPLSLESKLGQRTSTSTQPVAPGVGVATQISEPQQQHEILTTVKEVLFQQEERQAKLFHDVMEVLRSNEQRSTLSGVNNLPSIQKPQGLNAMEQAALVRHTIQQKDKLLTMNQELLNLQLRAQRLATSPLGEQAQHLAAPRSTGGKDVHHSRVSPVMALNVPAQPNAAVTVPKMEDTMISSGVQAGPCVTKREDAGTMTTPSLLPPPPPPPPPLSPQQQQQQQQPPWVVDSRGDSAATVAPDIPSTMSIGRTLSSFQQINADLLRFHAATEDMERALQESRGLLNKHASLGSAHVAAVEGSIMMDAARRRTAALEQQLTILNSASVKPLIEANQDGRLVDKSHDAFRQKDAPESCVQHSPAVDKKITENVKEVTAREVPSVLQRFTSEYVEADSDAALGVDLPPPPPPPSSSFFPFQGQGTKHLFHSHTEEALQRDPLSINDNSTVAQNGAVRAPTKQTRKAEPGASSSPLEAPAGGVGKSTSPRRTGVSPARKVMDLSQLYTAADASRRKSSVRKAAASANNSARMSSPPQPVPERFAMYISAAEPKKMPRGSGGNRAGSCAAAAQQHPATARPKTVEVMKMAVPESRSTKFPLSGRDRKRLDTLALHASKRLVELQRSFL